MVYVFEPNKFGVPGIRYPSASVVEISVRLAWMVYVFEPNKFGVPGIRYPSASVVEISVRLAWMAGKMAAKNPMANAPARR